MKFNYQDKKLSNNDFNPDKRKLKLIRKIYDDNRAGLDALKYL